MYKIYINDHALVLVDSAEVENRNESDLDLLVRYTGKPKTLFNYIDLLEKAREPQRILLHWPVLEELKSDFFRHFRLEEASGGLVQNSRSEVLFIYRRGFWDLPKGKIDPGETREEAAVREVKEETGLRQLSLGTALPTTYHTYRQSGRRFLKTTYWYRMRADQEDLVPEAKEQIEKAEWHDLSSFFKQPRRIHQNILDLLTYFEDHPGPEE